MKPTIDEQIEWQKQLLRNYPQAEFEGNAILKSLERLKQIDAQEPVAWEYREKVSDGVLGPAMFSNQPPDRVLNIHRYEVTPLITKPEVK